MKRTKYTLFKRLFQEESGQSTTEYILILAVVVMIAMKFKDTFGKKLTATVDNLGGKIDRAVED
jgi:Flp pilus assembly pilin Flp